MSWDNLKYSAGSPWWSFVSSLISWISSASKQIAFKETNFDCLKYDINVISHRGRKLFILRKKIGFCSNSYEADLKGNVMGEMVLDGYMVQKWVFFG